MTLRPDSPPCSFHVRLVGIGRCTEPAEVAEHEFVGGGVDPAAIFDYHMLAVGHGKRTGEEVYIRNSVSYKDYLT